MTKKVTWKKIKIFRPVPTAAVTWSDGGSSAPTFRAAWLDTQPNRVEACARLSSEAHAPAATGSCWLVLSTCSSESEIPGTLGNVLLFIIRACTHGRLVTVTCKTSIMTTAGCKYNYCSGITSHCGLLNSLRYRALDSWALRLCLYSFSSWSAVWSKYLQAICINIDTMKKILQFSICSKFTLEN